MKTNHTLPPGPDALPFLGNIFEFRKDSLCFLQKTAQQYGDIVHFKIGPYSVVLLNHPEFIKEVLSTHHDNFIKGRPLEITKKLLGEGLLTSEGEFHKRQSRIIQPAFHRRMLDAYAPAMTEYAERLMESWEDGMQIDMMEEMIKLSTGIAGKTMFNVDIESEVPEISQAMTTIMNLFGRVTLPGSEWLLKLPLPGTLQFYKAKTLLDQKIYRIIGERRRSGLDNGDLLSLLLQAQDTPGSNCVLTDQQIRDEALTLFLTAFDTTSLALAWSWYLLSQNPEAEAELHTEIDNVLQERAPTTEDYSRLVFTKLAFAESLRMYPPSYLIARQAVADFPIGSYVIPKGAIVLMSPYLIHRDSRFHQQPEQYLPRMRAERPEAQQAGYTFFPFGGGPRACIGQHYAWLEGVLVMSSIARYWRFTLVPGHRVETEQLINLRPKYGLMMRVHRRK